MYKHIKTCVEHMARVSAAIPEFPQLNIVESSTFQKTIKNPQICICNSPLTTYIQSCDSVRLQYKACEFK